MYYTTGVDALGFSPDGTLLVAGNAGGIRVWNRNGALVRELRGPSSNFDAVFVEDGGRTLIVYWGQWSNKEIAVYGPGDQRVFRRALQPPYQVEHLPGRGVRTHERAFEGGKYVERDFDIDLKGQETPAPEPMKKVRHLTPFDDGHAEVRLDASTVLRAAGPPTATATGR